MRFGLSANACRTVGKRFSFSQKSRGGLKLSIPNLPSFGSRSARTMGQPPSRSDSIYPSRIAWHPSFGLMDSPSASMTIFMLAAKRTRSKIVIDAEGQSLGVNDDLHAGGQTHKVVCVSHGVRLIEVVNTPTESALGIPPLPETIDMQITDRKNFGRTAKVSTD